VAAERRVKQQQKQKNTEKHQFAFPNKPQTYLLVTVCTTKTDPENQPKNKTQQTKQPPRS
jgi:hypothetical protein